MNRLEYETKTKDLHKEVYRLYMAGYKNQEIADATGYSKSNIVRILCDINGPKERRVLSESDRERIIKLRKEGNTIQKIATKIGFSISAVQKCLKDQEEIEKEDSDEEKLIPAIMTTRKPRIKVIYINGKRYKDVSEFYLGV